MSVKKRDVINRLCGWAYDDLQELDPGLQCLLKDTLEVLRLEPGRACFEYSWIGMERTENGFVSPRGPHELMGVFDDKGEHGWELIGFHNGLAWFKRRVRC